MGRNNDKGKDKFNAFVDIKPRPYQRKAIVAFENDNKNLALLWSRQLGKDLIAWLLTIRQAIQVAGSYLYFLPMTKQAKRAIWLKTVPNMGRVIHWIPQKKTGNPKKADGCGFGYFSIDNNSMIIQLECVNSTPESIRQSTIEVIGASERNADDFAGVSPTLCVFSEVAVNKTFNAIYRVLHPSILMNNTRQILLSTPRGKNHWHKFFHETKTDDNWYTNLTQVLHPDREGYYKQLTPEIIRASAKKLGMSDDWIEQEFGCSFEAKVVGTFYSVVMTRAFDEGRVGCFPYNNRKPVDVFFDIGLRDKAVMWFRQMDGNKVVFIDYFEDVNLGTDDVAEILKERAYRYGSFVLPWDGSSIVHGKKPTSFLKLLRASLQDFNVGGKVIKPVRKGTITSGIEATRMRFSRYHFDEIRCSIAIEHIQLYSAKRKSDGTFSDSPDHDDHSHCCDGLRTEAMSIATYNLDDRIFQTQYECDAPPR